MIELSVLNYFAIVLTGFGVVWSYRHFTGQQNKHISEFEYTAFSALWGIPIGLVVVIFSAYVPAVGKFFDAIPMCITVVFFPVGVFMGWIGAKYKKRKRK